MKINGKIIASGIIAIVIMIAGLVINLVISTKSSDEKMKVSLIVYDSDTSRWENLRQGAELALDGKDAEVSLVTMSAKANAIEQEALIEREAHSDADGILLAACDRDVIGQYLDKNKFPVPIVLVENGVDSQKEYDSVHVDDYAMGKALGEEIIRNENKIIKAAIIYNNPQIYGIRERYQGVLDVIEPVVNSVVVWERKENERYLSTQLYLQRCLTQEAVDVIIALDNEAADALIDALSNLNKTSKLYVMSTSDKSIYGLDQGSVKAVCYQAEFSIGYLGTKCLIGGKKASGLSDDVDYKVITKEDMYSRDIERLIFPYVK